MKWSIGRKIFLGYLVAILLVATISLVSLMAVKSLLANVKTRAATTERVEACDQLDNLLLSSEANVFRYHLTKDENYRVTYERELAEVPKLLELVQTLFANGQDRSWQTLSELGPLIEMKLDGMKQLVNQGRAPAVLAPTPAESIPAESIASGEKIHHLISQIVTLEKAKINDANALVGANSDRLNTVILVGTPIAIVLILIAGALLTRDIAVPLGKLNKTAAQISEGNLAVQMEALTRSDEVGTLSRSFAVMVTNVSNLIRQVQRSGLQVNSSAVEIAATTKQQQTTASEVASTTTEISATAREISASSMELLKVTDDVGKVSEHTSGLASQGKSGLARMESIMKQITDASAAVTSKLGVMNDKAGNINAVITTITKVADQTNLLSLNAAIEAEKAGEYGRGFAVVAAEIRRLADQTASSTLDIERIVKDMVAAVSAGVMGMDKFSEEVRRGGHEISQVSTQLDQVILQVQSLTPSIDAVNNGMRSQNQGSQQISDALVQLGEAARQTADSIRDSGRAIDQLNDATQGLQTSISRFKLPDVTN